MIGGRGRPYTIEDSEAQAFVPLMLKNSKNLQILFSKMDGRQYQFLEESIMTQKTLEYGGRDNKKLKVAS